MILTSEVRGQIVGDKGSYSTLMWLLLHYGLVFRYRFTFSRTTLRTSHQALMVAKNKDADSNLGKILFPIFISPMMVPIILVAIGLFYFFVQFKLVGSVLGLVLGHSLVAMPLVLIIVFSALKNYDMNQEKVARSLGATRFRAFREITLPQIKFSIVSASLIAFLTSFDEIIISLFVAGGDNSTITRSMFLALRDQIDPTIAAISTILIIVSSGLLILVQLLGNKDKST